MHRLMPLLAAVYCLSYSLSSNAQTLTPGQIDMGTLYGSPSNPDDLLEYNERTYMDQLIDNNVTATTTGDGGFLGSGLFEGQTTTYSVDSWTATTGCLDPSASNGGDGSWGETSGGSCANIGINGDGAIRFGYNNTIVSQTQDIINDALKVAGVQVVGYLWQWKVKNYNALDTSENQVNNQDPLFVRVIVKDNDGNIVDEREWDYSYPISDWEQKNGMVWYNPFLMGDEVDSLTIEVEGRDAGYWAGWWGPEFREAGIYSIFVYKEPIDCSNPLNDPTCPGYATALQEQQEAMLAEQLAMAEMTNDTGTTTEEFTESSPTEETFEESVSEPALKEEAQASEKLEETEIVKEIEEAVVEEIVETEQASALSSSSTTKQSSSKVRVNPLDIAQGAVNDANETAQSSVSTALTSAFQSNEESTSFIIDQVTASANESSSMDQQLTESVQSAADLRNQENLLELERNIQSIEAEVAAAIQSVEDANQISIETTDNLIDQTLTETVTNIDTSQQNDTFTSDEKFVEQQLAALQIPDNVLQLEIIVEDYTADAVNDTLNSIISKLTSPAFEFRVVNEEEEIVEPFSSSEVEELVEKAKAGSEDESAKVALLGFNPSFSIYQTPQMPDTSFYEPKDIYPNQKNHDNPAGRFFNGASDDLHRKMVRQQYDQ
jgi:hypothetical protein